MSGFALSFSRELRSLVATPLIWGVAAAVAIPAGMGFAFGGLVSGAVADLSRAIGISLWCVGAAACALAARSVPAERRAGTWDFTLASPIDVATILHAKFAAICVASVVLIIPIVLQTFLLSCVSSPSWSVILCGAFGLWMLIIAAAGVGMLAGVVVRSSAGAIIASLTGIAAWIALCRGGQSLGLPAIASAAFALDPLRRGEDFTRGSFDLGSGLSLLAMGVGCAWCAGAWAIDEQEKPSNRSGLLRVIMSVGVFTAIIASVIAFRGWDAPTARVEAATLFSGSLQPATGRLIATCEPPLNVTLLSSAGNSDTAALRNARGIMARLAGQVVSNGTIVGLQEFDSLAISDAEQSAAMFEMIEAGESKNVSAWRDAITKGLTALRSIESFSDAAAPQIQTLLKALAKDDATRGKLEMCVAAMQKTATDGHVVREAISQMASATPDKPLGNIEGAGRKLAIELKWWSSTLQEVSDISGKRLQSGTPALITSARQTERNCVAQAELAKVAQDRIDQLPPLRLSEVTSAMRYPPTLIISGANGVAAIPAWQMNASVDATELALAEAIRCVQGAPRIVVTIVHSQTKSPLESVTSGGDLSLIVQSLCAARMEVQEWNPFKGARPLTQAGKRVWIVIPPLDRSAQEPDPAENALLAATRGLLAQNESVLVIATPNPFAAMGISDPWADLLLFAGLRAKSGQVVLDLVTQSENTKEIRSFVEFPGSSSTHPATLAAANENILWPMPIPIEIKTTESWNAFPMESIPPAGQRWIETDPRVASRTMDAAPVGKVFTQAIPVLVAAQRDDGARVAMSGGLSWLLTLHGGILDGEQGALRYPGNRDVLIGVIRWLAGSEPIATVSATGRIPQLSHSTRIMLGSGALVIIPFCMAFTGAMIWKARRRQ